MAFLLVGVALDVAQVLGLILVLLCYFSDVDPSGWMVSSMVFLLPLIFLRGLGLRLTCISKRGIMGFSLISVLILPSNFVPVFLG